MADVQFYYIREAADNEEDGGLPVVTVCLVQHETEKKWARGVAVLSPGDRPNKAHGRALAKNRALGVLRRGTTIPFGTYKSGHTGTRWPTVFDYSEDLTDKLSLVLESDKGFLYDGYLAIAEATLTHFEQKVLGLVSSNDLNLNRITETDEVTV